MKTPEQATKMHEQKFESKREEFDKIIDNAIENNFDISKGVVEVKDKVVVNIYNMFQEEVVEYCDKNGRKLTLGKYEKSCRNEEYPENMLVLIDNKKLSNGAEDDPMKEMDNLNEKKIDGLVKKYSQTYGGDQLMKKYSGDRYGTREIRGEDSNCDLGGPHSNPQLGFLEGKLEDVIRKAVVIDKFWTRGTGGEINLVDIKK